MLNLIKDEPAKHTATTHKGCASSTGNHSDQSNFGRVQAKTTMISVDSAVLNKPSFNKKIMVLIQEKLRDFWFANSLGARLRRANRLLDHSIGGSNLQLAAFGSHSVTILTDDPARSSSA